MRATRWVTRAVLLVVGAVLVVAPLIFALQERRAGPEPHALEVGISAPVLVAQSVAERAAALPGRPFDPVVLLESVDPTDDVRRGLLDLVVTIDFTVETDQLLVSATIDPDLVREVEVRLEAISTSFGRGLDVVVVDPARSGDAWRGTPYVMIAVWVVLGLVLSVGLSWWRGPVAVSPRDAARRVSVLTAASSVAGLGVALVVAFTTQAGLLPTAGVGALAVGATAWTVLAAEALAGLAGLGLAVSLVLGTLAPLLALVEPTALPRPWPAVVPWTIPGAALDLVGNEVFFGGTVLWRPLAVLASWVLVALLALVLTRRARAGPGPS